MLDLLDFPQLCVFLLCALEPRSFLGIALNALRGLLLGVKHMLLDRVGLRKFL